jgi:Methyltransferase FkbM domain
MASAPLRRFVRGIVEPREGVPRRLPLGPGSGIRLQGDREPSLDQWFGLFESELAPYVRRFCTPGTRCVDVGSYNAYYALVFAKLSAARVRSYEPDARAAARSRRNVALNPGLATFIEIRQAAVGAATDPRRSCLTLDEDLADWGPAGLLKIDVEGAEADVLSGASELLARDRPHVIVETHAWDLEVRCADALLRAGYRPHIVTPRRLLPQRRSGSHNRWLVADRRRAFAVDGSGF